MANGKITFFFEGSGPAKTGWTETWYTSDDSFLTMGALADSYLLPRRGLLGPGAEIKYWRTESTDPAKKRSTRVRFMTGTEGKPYFYTSSPADDFDPSQSDLLLRIDGNDSGGVTARRSLMLAGIPDSQTDQLKAQGINAPYVTNGIWTGFSTFVKGAFLIRKGKSPTFSYIPIVNVQPIMMRNRKRGRPFELFRGRRLA